jgi:hypothetical protein
LWNKITSTKSPSWFDAAADMHPPATFSGQSLAHTLALHDVLIVPLEGPGLAEPAANRLDLDILDTRESRLGGLLLAHGRDRRLLERLAAPEQQPDAARESAVADQEVAPLNL